MMAPRTTQLLLLCLVLLRPVAQAAEPLQLVSAEEAAAAQAAAPAPEARTRGLPSPAAPRILIQAPVLQEAPLVPPLRIAVQFQSAGDAEIDPASFRVLYGPLRLDVTGRILQAVRVDKTGLSVDNVSVPAGSHRLLLRVADTQHRVGEAEVRFAVRPAEH